MHVSKLILLIVFKLGQSRELVWDYCIFYTWVVPFRRGVPREALGRVPVLTGRATVRQFAIVNDIEICLLSKNSKEFFSEYYGSV